jgi:hypothetical protein
MHRNRRTLLRSLLREDQHPTAATRPAARAIPLVPPLPWVAPLLRGAQRHLCSKRTALLNSRQPRRKSMPTQLRRLQSRRRTCSKINGCPRRAHPRFLGRRREVLSPLYHFQRRPSPCPLLMQPPHRTAPRPPPRASPRFSPSSAPSSALPPPPDSIVRRLTAVSPVSAGGSGSYGLPAAPTSSWQPPRGTSSTAPPSAGGMPSASPPFTVSPSPGPGRWQQQQQQRSALSPASPLGPYATSPADFSGHSSFSGSPYSKAGSAYGVKRMGESSPRLHRSNGSVIEPHLTPPQLRGGAESSAAGENGTSAAAAAEGIEAAVNAWLDHDASIAALATHAHNPRATPASAPPLSPPPSDSGPPPARGGVGPGAADASQASVTHSSPPRRLRQEQQQQQRRRMPSTPPSPAWLPPDAPRATQPGHLTTSGAGDAFSGATAADAAASLTATNTHAGAHLTSSPLPLPPSAADTSIVRSTRSGGSNGGGKSDAHADGDAVFSDAARMHRAAEATFLALVRSRKSAAVGALHVKDLRPGAHLDAVAALPLSFPSSTEGELGVHPARTWLAPRGLAPGLLRAVGGASATASHDESRLVAHAPFATAPPPISPEQLAGAVSALCNELGVLPSHASRELLPALRRLAHTAATADTLDRFAERICGAVSSQMFPLTPAVGSDSLRSQRSVGLEQAVVVIESLLRELQDLRRLHYVKRGERS